MDASDSSLLREFLSETGQKPFRQLVKRYQDLVYSTALRRTGDRGRAEEVAQDVFLFLSKQARVLVRHPNLAGWLYKTTLKKAANRMKSEQRRRERENRFAQEADLASEESLPPEAFALVDEALEGLPESDREALVLRYFQDLELKEVGRALGSSAEAARKRVDRALAKLGESFRRKGVAVPSAAVAATVLSQSTHSAPAGLLATATGAAVVPAVPSAFSTVLTYLITMSKTQATIVVVLLAAIPLGLQQVSLAKLKSEREELARKVAAKPARPSAGGGGVRPSALTGAPGGSPRENEEAVSPLDVLLEDGNFDALKAMGNQIRRSQVAAKVKTLSEAMGLEEELAAVIKEHALKNLVREDERMGALMKGIANSGNNEELEKVMAESKEIEPFDGIDALMSEEQAERYGEWAKEQEEAELRKIGEQMAYEELADLQQLFRLSDEEKNKALEILVSEWTDLDEEEPATGVQRDFAEEMRLEREERLRRMSEFLTEDQVRIYREHLEDELK